MNKETKKSNKCLKCNRPTHKESKYCIFHASAKEKTKKEFKEELKEYISKINEKDKNYRFEGFVFVGDLNFKRDLDITIFKNANFKHATFTGYANFLGTTFNGYSYFQYATFTGSANFLGTTFNGYSYFQYATFTGSANFKYVVFNRSANFVRTTFKGNADFKLANFKGEVDFMNAFLDKNAIFRSITFNGNANFRSTIFNGSADFMNETFNEDANFRYTTFKKAYFNNTTFNEDAHFGVTTFNEDANFKDVIFKGNVSFAYATLVPRKKLNIKVKNRGIINFGQTNLENVFLGLDLDEGVLIDFTNVLLRNTKTQKKQIVHHILQENRKEFTQAREVYLLLKNNFHSIGRYEDESWAFKKEKDMDRLTYSLIKYIENKNEKVYYGSIQLFSNLIESYFGNKKGYILGKDFKNQIYFYSLIIFRRLRNFVRWIFSKNILKYLSSQFLNIICGYGEKPIRVIVTSLFIVFICAILYMSVGIYYGSGSENLVMYSLLNEYKSIINSNDPLFYLTTINWNKIYSFFYFSAVTFTTLGFGDFHPSEGLCRVYASIEAFIGAFMMALFIYTFVRKTRGR